MTVNESTLVTAGAYERLRLLTTYKTIAMIGLSPDPMRPSHFAAIYMLSNGYDIIPVNPRVAGETILGQKVYASLADIPRPVEIVDVFRKPSECVPIAEQAVAIGAKVLWLQLGVIND
jgi:predicted CoA-binding protein